MKIGKSIKKEEIKNPFRPQVGIKRKFTVCRITMDSSLPVKDESAFSMQLDADEEPTFIFELESLVPKSDRYKDSIYELLFLKPKWKDLILDLSKDYFSEIILVENGQIKKIKGKNP